MNRNFSTLIAAVGLCAFAACTPKGEVKSYNEGINIIPWPQHVEAGQGTFELKDGLSFAVQTDGARTVADFFAAKIARSTGYDVEVGDAGQIALVIDTAAVKQDEGYTLDVTADGVRAVARTEQGLFYAMQSFMQLLPAEIEEPERVRGIAWQAPAVSIEDAPRFAYRGTMIDPCRHFITVEDIKKQIDVFALFKINRLHWHLTDDQGWRIEIKKYPRLTKVGATRIEGEGYEHKGYYTQEEIKDVVAYAAERHITVIPEIEVPGHAMAAIAAYPELSCEGKQLTPRIIWGVEDIVLCAGRDETFDFFADVIREVAALFPGEYIHLGGDECPKTSWQRCPLCQKRIREEGLYADGKHTAEQRLQSYFVTRMEKVVNECGKKMIGWDETLEGGIAPSATIMSWRGNEGGIASALLGHDAIMAPAGEGLYLDLYQGDSKVEPVAIYGTSLLSKTYSYNPIPDTLVALGRGHHILGVQGNVWAEYLYDLDLREYRTYPRLLAVSEIGWTEMENKDYDDFCRRLENAYVRLDAHDINYHIPMPEQPNGSCDFVAFTDSAVVEFTTSRPVKMVYTTDGSEPTAESAEYVSPLTFTVDGVVKIASVLPSGKMSRVRTINVEKQTLAPSVDAGRTAKGLEMDVTYGYYLNMDAFNASTEPVAVSKVIGETKELISFGKPNEGMRDVKQYGAVAQGYLDVAEDGVYYFSTEFEQLWIDGQLLIDNTGEVKKFCRRDKSVALAKGKHEVKVVFLGHIIGGFPSNWGDGDVRMRKSDSDQWMRVTGDMLSHKL